MKRMAPALAVCVALSACQGPSEREALASDIAPDSRARASRLVVREHISMGAPVQLSAWTDDEPRAERAFVAAFTEFDRLDTLLSVWKEGSDVERLNVAAGRGPVSVSGDTLTVLEHAIEVGGWTEGKFDITFGALSDVWRFDHDQDDTIPTPSEIAARVPLVDYRQVVVDRRAGTAVIRRAGMRVHLGGIGKGYAVDRVVTILRQHGLRDFMVQSGGDLYVSGMKDGQPWRLGIRDPRGPADRVFASLDLSDRTFSTSGDYERSFMANGVRYHHLLDPASGQPARQSRSVTIVSARAVVADALSTGVFVLGPERGMALIEKLPDVEGVIVSSRNEVLVSSGLRDRLNLVMAPTDAP
jgi:thiamine biosynthesis lipoprotein